MKTKKRIYEIIEKAREGDKASRIFDIFIIFLIMLNVLSVILESFQNLATTYNEIFRIFELFSITVFSIEIILRCYTSDLKCKRETKLRSLLAYIISPMAIIDLLAILPFYLPILIPIDLRFLRILRLTRILRVLKVNRYSRSLELIGKIIERKKSDLLVTTFITMLLLLLASSIMFYLENESQPESFPNIIASFWWAIATLTTVGYGDVYPITVLGKVVSGIIALLGIGLVALPTGIISSGFIEILEEKKGDSDKIRFCKYCGKPVDDEHFLQKKSHFRFHPNIISKKK